MALHNARPRKGGLVHESAADVMAAVIWGVLERQRLELLLVCFLVHVLLERRLLPLSLLLLMQRRRRAISGRMRRQGGNHFLGAVHPGTRGRGEMAVVVVGLRVCLRVCLRVLRRGKGVPRLVLLLLLVGMKCWLRRILRLIFSLPVLVLGTRARRARLENTASSACGQKSSS